MRDRSVPVPSVRPLPGSTLLVAGEPSGDALARAVFPALPSVGPLSYFGPEGSLPAGVRRVGTAPMAGMGLAAAPTRLAHTAIALRRLVSLASASRISRAVLFNWTEASAWLGRALRARGIPVLQVVAPQVFAWRRGRLHTFGRSCDALAVLFAFEEPLWRAAGVRARFVGHPLAEAVASPSPPAPTAGRRRVTLLPGSRAHEIARLLPDFIAAGRDLRADGLSPRIVLSSRLPKASARFARDAAARADIPVEELSPTERLGALVAGDAVAIAASGTATLECALADVPPVIAYRVDPASAVLFRALARTRHIGLPNVLLARGVFPEIVQGDVSGTSLAEAARALVAAPPRVRDELLPMVTPPGGIGFGDHVAALAAELRPR